MTKGTRKRSPTFSSKSWIAGVAIGLAATLIGTIGSRFEFADRVENNSYDWRVRWASAPPDPTSPVVIVEINESSIRSLEPVVGRWPWPRMVHASAIDYLARAGAKVIAYDVLFTEREGRSETVINGRAVTGEDSDRALVDAVGRAGNVILIGDATYEGLASGADVPPRQPVRSPYRAGAGFEQRAIFAPPFSDLADAAASIAHNRLVKDLNSDFARRMLPFIDVGGVTVPSLGIAAALEFASVSSDDVGMDGSTLRVRDTRMPMLPRPVSNGGPSRQVLLRFSKPTNDAQHVRSIFPTFSFFDVLLSEDRVSNNQPPAIPPAAFEGKLVLVGTTAAGLYDRYATPFEGGASGVELHGTIADNVLSRRFMRRCAPAIDALLALATGLGAGLASTLLPVSIAIGIALAGMAGVITWLTYEVGQGLWIGAVPTLASTAVALFGGVGWRYLVEDRAKREIRGLFGRYVSKDVIEQLMTNPALTALGGERRNMTVLFSDIRGFTTASEKGTPETVVAQLNEYFGAMVDVLFRHQGTLDKFVGDMVMGLFGAPLPDERHADHAVAAALEMVDELARLNTTWAAEGRPALDIGIGINTGEMIAGNIGSEAIMSYTVIGDAVNLGSRLESLNKEFGTHILISEATRERLTLPVATRPLGTVTVKGRTQPVAVYEVTKNEGALK